MTYCLLAPPQKLDLMLYAKGLCLTLCLTLWLTLWLTLAAPTAAIAIGIGSVEHHIDTIRTLYNAVNRTAPSSVNAIPHQKIIESRLNCYSENENYPDRIKICNNVYAKDIVRVARKNIKSRPAVGAFVSQVGLCPILYNICMGKTEDDKERCITFERQCIDYNLDTYWRGAPQYGQQYYSQ